MPTNNYPGVGYTTLGYDRNFFQKATITATTFGGESVDGYQPDMIVGFNTACVMFTNYSATTSTTNVIEYSFNGQTVHGELGSNASNFFLTFYDRPVSKIWFRVQSGSGSTNIAVQAWSTP